MLRRTSDDARADNASPDLAERGEARLVSEIAAGELRAFEQLYRAYHPRLTRFLDRITRRPSMAGELLNDTMWVVWNRADSYNGRSKVSTWIFAIAYRRALSAMRGLREPVEDKDAETRESPDEGPEQQLGRLQVHNVLIEAMVGSCYER